MDSIKMAALMTSDPVAKRYFVGVYARDDLPSYLPAYPAALICNTDDASGPGEHWVSMFFDTDGHADYYDPLGLPPLFKEWEHYLQRHSQSWTYNSHTVQSTLSSACGYHVVYYLLWRSRGRDPSAILKCFVKKDPRRNDIHVVDFVSDYYYSSE